MQQKCDGGLLEEIDHNKQCSIQRDSQMTPRLKRPISRQVVSLCGSTCIARAISCLVLQVLLVLVLELIISQSTQLSLVRELELIIQQSRNLLSVDQPHHRPPATLTLTITMTIATMMSTTTTTTNTITTIDHLQHVVAKLPVNFAHSHCNKTRGEPWKMTHSSETEIFGQILAFGAHLI